MMLQCTGGKWYLARIGLRPVDQNPNEDYIDTLYEKAMSHVSNIEKKEVAYV